MEVAIPNRASPSGSKVLERMAKFGQSADAGSVPSGGTKSRPEQATITTRNRATDKFERFTHSAKEEATMNEMAESQPQFDIDIQVRHEDASMAAGAPEDRLTLWDTQIPVRDDTEKVSYAFRLLMVFALVSSSETFYHC